MKKILNIIAPVLLIVSLIGTAVHEWTVRVEGGLIFLIGLLLFMLNKVLRTKKLKSNLVKIVKQRKHLAQRIFFFGLGIITTSFSVLVLSVTPISEFFERKLFTCLVPTFHPIYYIGFTIVGLLMIRYAIINRKIFLEKIEDNLIIQSSGGQTIIRNFFSTQHEITIDAENIIIVPEMNGEIHSYNKIKLTDVEIDQLANWISKHSH